MAATTATTATPSTTSTAIGGGFFGGPIGTWNQVVHTPTAAEQTEVSIHADGTVSAISQSGPSPCANLTVACTLGMPSEGVWKNTGPNKFEYTIKEYVYDSTGALNAFIIPHDSVTLGGGGNSFTSTAVTGIWNATNNTLVTTVTATATGTRMTFPSY